MNTTTANKAKFAAAVLGMAFAVNSCSGIWDASIDPTWFYGDGQIAIAENDAPNVGLRAIAAR